MKRMVFALLVMVLFAGTAMAGDTRPQIVVLESNDGCGGNSIQIMPNGDFEGVPHDAGWEFSNSLSFIGGPGYESDYALEQGTQVDSLTAAVNTLEGIDFSNYLEPIVLSMCYSIFTWELEINGEMDVSEGSFYTEEGMSVAYLWRLSNLDQGIWQPNNCNYYEVWGLTTWDTQLVFRIAASNSDKLGTTFWYDNITICAVPKYSSYQPAFMNGG